MGYLIRVLLCPRCMTISRLMVVFGLSCRSITLVYLVVVIFMMCLLIHIWILPIMSVGHNRFNLIADRSRKGRSAIILVVHVVFLSHLIDQLILM